MDIIERLKSDATGDVALQIFEDRVLDHAVDLANPEAWNLLDWTYEFFRNDPNYEDIYRPPMAYEDAKNLALKALEDHDVETAKELLKRAQPNPRRRGRPSKVETAAVKAFVYHTYLGWHWGKLADHFYPCDHTSKPCLSCRESLRRTVGRLQQQLRQYNVQFLPE